MNTHTCSDCVRSIDHLSHNKLLFWQILITKRKYLKDLNELENQIYPKYKERLNYIQVLQSFLKEYICASKMLLKHGKKNCTEKYRHCHHKYEKSNKKINSNHLVGDQRNKSEIIFSKCKVTQIINILKNCYNSKNAEIKRLPPKLSLSIPVFSHRKIYTKGLSKGFSRMSDLPVSKDKNVNSLKSLRKHLHHIKISIKRLSKVKLI